MNEMAFVQKREPDWQALTRMCDRADLSPTKLQPDEFHEFIRLYRRVSTDLATVRTRSNNVQLISFLNDLVGRTYGILYRSPKRGFGEVLHNALATSAQTVRRSKFFILTSFLLFVASYGLTFLVMSTVPSSHNVFVPPAQKELFESWKSGKFEERGFEDSTQMTGFYMSNNPTVSIMAAGIAASTFGLGTVAMLYQNGAMLGALGHEMASVGKLPHLFLSIAPHGVTEMSGMIISASAGLILGWALINPGRRKRGDSLKAAGRDAIVLLVTSWIMMFIAAPIEGFFSFNPRVPDIARIAFALLSATAWGIFWIYFGKSSRSEVPQLG